MYLVEEIELGTGHTLRYLPCSSYLDADLLARLLHRAGWPCVISYVDDDEIRWGINGQEDSA